MQFDLELLECAIDMAVEDLNNVIKAGAATSHAVKSDKSLISRVVGLDAMCYIYSERSYLKYRNKLTSDWKNITIGYDRNGIATKLTK